MALEDAELGPGDRERGRRDGHGGRGQPAVQPQQPGRDGGEHQAERAQGQGRPPGGAQHVGRDPRVVSVLRDVPRGRRLDAQGQDVDDEHDAHQGRDHRVAVRTEPAGGDERERVGRDVHGSHADGDEDGPPGCLRTCCRPRHA